MYRMFTLVVLGSILHCSEVSCKEKELTIGVGVRSSFNQAKDTSILGVAVIEIPIVNFRVRAELGGGGALLGSQDDRSVGLGTMSFGVGYSISVSPQWAFVPLIRLGLGGGGTEHDAVGMLDVTIELRVVATITESAELGLSIGGGALGFCCKQGEPDPALKFGGTAAVDAVFSF